MTQIKTREEWLTRLVDDMRNTLFSDQGIIVPSNIRVSVGWPSVRKAIGECWADASSADGTREIFISPKAANAMDVAAILAHEVAHACLPFGVGHRAPFKKIVYAIGLTGKATATVAGDDFKHWARKPLKRLGDYPHATLSRLNGKKKQTTRLIRVHCTACEDAEEPYIVRMSATTIQRGAPICPIHNVNMSV